MHSLDSTITQRLAVPGAWEDAMWRASAPADRADWEWILDGAPSFRHNDAVLRCVDSEARLQEYTRKQWAMPAPAVCSAGPQPSVFRRLFIDGGTAATRDSWFDASYAAVDSGTSKISDWLDYIDPTHSLHQSTSSAQSPVPSADAGMANALSAPFTGSITYPSTRAASDWSHGHNGAGCEFFTVWTPTSDLAVNHVWGTRNSGVGVTHYRGSGAKHAIFMTSGPSFSTGTSLALNAGTYTVWRYKENDSPEYNALTKTASVSSGSVASPSGSACETPYTIGLVGGFAPAFKWRASYCFHSLTAAARTIVAQKIQSETGIT